MAEISAADVKQIVVACEAGMGSSVMVARQLAKQLKPQGISVVHAPVSSPTRGHPARDRACAPWSLRPRQASRSRFGGGHL